MKGCRLFMPATAPWWREAVQADLTSAGRPTSRRSQKITGKAELPVAVWHSLKLSK
jgi:hypothetical protein